METCPLCSQPAAPIPYGSPTPEGVDQVRQADKSPGHPAPECIAHCSLSPCDGTGWLGADAWARDTRAALKRSAPLSEGRAMLVRTPGRGRRA